MAHKFNYPIWSALSLQRDSTVPLHEQVFEQVRQAIVGRQLAKGARLPPTRSLAVELNVSRSTIVLVYERLLSEGYVSGRVGAGTFIADILPEDTRPDAERAAPAPQAPPGQVSRRAQALLDLALPAERDSSFDLSPTVPALDQLPFDQFAKVSSQYWRSAPASDLGYGLTYGLPELQRQIASYLGEAHGLSCVPEQILVVSGTTQAFSLAGHVLADHGDRVIVEDPGYITRSSALMAGGLELVHVPIDQQGLDSSSFARYAPDARLVIASPTNQFPFGSTMPLERRLSLLQWADEREAWIIEYDFNNAFHFSGRALPPLAALDRRGRVVYVGNFNRAMSPALNLAYAVLPLDLVEAFARASQVFSFHAAAPMQGVVADLMASGQLASHMRRMGGRYRERAKLIVQCLQTLTGDSFALSEVGAGLHLSAIARAPLDDAAISQALLAHRIDVPCLSSYCTTAPARQGFVFGFGNTSAERIASAVERFSEELRRQQALSR